MVWACSWLHHPLIFFWFCDFLLQSDVQWIRFFHSLWLTLRTESPQQLFYLTHANCNKYVKQETVGLSFSSKIIVATTSNPIPMSSQTNSLNVRSIKKHRHSPNLTAKTFGARFNYPSLIARRCGRYSNNFMPLAYHFLNAKVDIKDCRINQLLTLCLSLSLD